MNASTAFYVASCLVAIATIALRSTRWRSLAPSRPFTVALTLLLVGAALRNPTLWAGQRRHVDAATADVHLANFTDLLGDLLLAAAAGYIGTVVLHAWGLSEKRTWLARGVAATALAMTLLWAVSNAPRTPTKYVGDLGGPALVYTYVAATTILAANLAVLVSVLVVRAERKIRLALLPLGLGAFIGAVDNVLRLGTHAAGGVFVDVRVCLDEPLTAAMILLYSVSGLIGYVMTANMVDAHRTRPARHRLSQTSRQAADLQRANGHGATGFTEDPGRANEYNES